MPMAALTTRQRDILRILLETSNPLGMAEIATLMNLSPRQVSYSLKGIRSWSAQKKIPLKVKPGVGVMLEASRQQTHQLEHEFGAKSGLQLILSAGQRQQLLTLLLLTGLPVESLAQIAAAGQAIQQMGPTRMLISLGKDGALFLQPG
jgi:transcriptional antiterminator